MCRIFLCEIETCCLKILVRNAVDIFSDIPNITKGPLNLTTIFFKENVRRVLTEAISFLHTSSVATDIIKNYFAVNVG